MKQLESHIAHFSRKYGHELMRIGLGLVFFWFGAPKLVPGLSPAEELVRRTVWCCDPSWFVPTLGLFEVVIGVCLMTRRASRLGLLLMAVHMIGAGMPLLTLPDIAWKSFPVATLEGQYILKNVVLMAAAFVLVGRRACEVQEVRRAEA